MPFFCGFPPIFNHFLILQGFSRKTRLRIVVTAFLGAGWGLNTSEFEGSCLIKAVIKGGELYAKLPDEQGKRSDLVNPVNEVTDRQQAEKALGKSRVTISQWVKLYESIEPISGGDRHHLYQALCE